MLKTRTQIIPKCWYSWTNSTKSPASGADNVSEPMLSSQVGEAARSLVRVDKLCFCSQSGGGAGIGLLT